MSGVKFFLVAFVFNSFEVFDMGDTAGYERCRRITDGIEAREQVAMPKRLAELLDEERVEAMMCVDEGTLLSMVFRKYGKPPPISDPDKPLSKLPPPPRLLLPVPPVEPPERPGDKAASDL